MNVLVRLVDEDGVGARSDAVVLAFDAPRVTVGELIRRRVLDELERREGSEEVGPDEAVRVAQEAFERNAVFVFVDDVQVMELEERVVLREASLVRFVRLLPLVGG